MLSETPKPFRFETFQILKGDKLHFGVVPKLGSSAIRNFYAKDIEHAQSSHKERRLSEIDGKIILPLKNIQTAWYSGIYTDFMASLINPTFLKDTRIPKEFPRFPHWIGRLDDNDILRYFNYLVCHHESTVRNLLQDKPNVYAEFKRFYTDLLFNAFHLSRDLSWLYTGHASDIMRFLAKSVFDDRFIFTDIKNLNNIKFINWLQENDPNGWNHLDVVKITTTKKKFGIINVNDREEPNLFNVKPPNFTKNIISYINTLDNPDNYFKFEDTVHLKPSELDWNTSTVPYLNLWRIEAYETKIHDVQFLINQVLLLHNNDRIIKFENEE